MLLCKLDGGQVKILGIKQDSPNKGVGFACGDHRPLLYLCLLAIFSHFESWHGIRSRGSARCSPQPTQVAQVVQDGSLVCQRGVQSKETLLLCSFIE